MGRPTRASIQARARPMDGPRANPSYDMELERSRGRGRQDVESRTRRASAAPSTPSPAARRRWLLAAACWPCAGGVDVPASGAPTLTHLASAGAPLRRSRLTEDDGLFCWPGLGCKCQSGWISFGWTGPSMDCSDLHMEHCFFFFNFILKKINNFF